MTEDSFHERWESVTGDGREYLRFELVQNKRSQRADLHAFLLLDELFPGHCDIVGSADHDQIWLEVTSEQFETLTDEQIVELSRCGVWHESDSDSLTMFV